jgi:TfoX/Sxy family transcriptional regulator of competence genes
MSWKPSGSGSRASRRRRVGRSLSFVGRAEDEIRIDAEDALGAIEGLDVRRMFSGWGFYQRGLLFAAAWEGEFRFRTRQGRHWIYEAVDRELLGRPDELVSEARSVLARLEAEPAAARTGKRRPGAARRRHVG